jgi:predicted nuclease with TOPRIM domain
MTLILIGISSDDFDAPEEDDDYFLIERKYLPYPVIGAIPPDVIFGEDEDQDILTNLMTADEKVEELQNIINQKNDVNGGLREGKENIDEYGKIRQLENRLDEVVKENEKLIDELQDRKFEVYKLKNQHQCKDEIFDTVENEIGDAITEVMKRMGNSKKSVQAVQNALFE